MGARRGVVSASEYLLITASEQLELTKEVNTTVESAVPLTEFTLTEDQIRTLTADAPSPKDPDPYDNQTPVALMSREYSITNGTITVPNVASTVTYFNFPHFAVTNGVTIANVLYNYSFIRWKSIEYRILVTCSPFLYGWIGWTGLPHDARRYSTTSRDYGWLSHDDCVIQDITSQDEVRISIPWMSPQEWLSVQTLRENTTKELSAWGLKCVLPSNCLRQYNTDAPNHIGLTIYARFVGIELAGFVSPSINPEPSHESQSSSTLTSAIGVVAATGAAIAGEKISKYFTNKASEAVDAGLKYAEGVVANNPIYNVTIAAEQVEGTVDNAEAIKPNMFGGLTFTPPRNLLGDGSNGLVDGTATHHSVLKYLQIPSFVDHMTVSATGRVSLNKPLFGNPFYPGISHDASCSRIRFMGNFYRFWRGSLRYTFIFIASPLDSWRVSLDWAYNSGTNVNIAGDNPNRTVTVRGSNMIHVTVPWLYPFDWDFCQLDIDNEPVSQVHRYFTTTGPLYVLCQSTATAQPMDILVYESVADDFQMSGYREAGSPGFPVIPPTHESQMKTSEFCYDSVIGGRPTNLAHPSTFIPTFEGMARRWSGRSDIVLTTSIPQYYDNKAGYNMGSFDAISSIFHFYRGSQKFKYFFAMPTDGYIWYIFAVLENYKQLRTGGIPLQFGVADGATAIVLQETFVLEYVLPYFSVIDWQPVNGEQGVYLNHTEQTQVNVFAINSNSPGAPEVPSVEDVMVSACSDFLYKYSLPPPYWEARWYDNYDPPPLNGKEILDLNKLRVGLRPDSKFRVIKIAPVPRRGDSFMKTFCHENDKRKRPSSKEVVAVSRGISFSKTVSLSDDPRTVRGSTSELQTTTTSEARKSGF